LPKLYEANLESFNQFEIHIDEQKLEKINKKV